MVDSFKDTIKDNFRKYKRIMQELLKVQNPCFDQNLEACRYFGILIKNEWQTTEEILQNKLFLIFLEVSWSKTSIYSKTINVFNLLSLQFN